MCHKSKGDGNVMKTLEMFPAFTGNKPELKIVLKEAHVDRNCENFVLFGDRLCDIFLS